MSSSDSYFVTEFGHKIEFVPGYHERFSTLCDAVLDHSYVLDGETPRTLDQQKPPDTDNVAKKLVLFSQLVYFLERWGLVRKFETSIDLGGSYGMISAFLKGAGYVENATNVDLVDYPRHVPKNYFDFYLHVLNERPDERAEKIEPGLKRAKWTYDYFPLTDPLFGVVTKFERPCVVDEFRHQNLFDVQGEYDLVFTLGTLDILDPDEAFAKIRSLLSPDGMYVGIEENWWYFANASAITAHFPFAHQRLSYADLERYMAEFHPERLSMLKARDQYMYAGKRPTLNDLCAAAARQGLRPLGIDRILPKLHHRGTGAKILRNPDYDPIGIMRDVHALRPDVSEEDLMTSVFNLAFTKA